MQPSAGLRTAIIQKNPVISALLRTSSGLLAVLDQQRNVLAANQTYMKSLGLKDLEEFLGLRPGKALRCVHPQQRPQELSQDPDRLSCGAAIAIVTSQKTGEPAELDCAMTLEHAGAMKDMYYRVRSVPFQLAGETCLLLFMQDITRQNRWAALAKTFFHDFNNLLTGLEGAMELLQYPDQREDPKFIEQITRLVLRMRKELDIQRFLAETEMTRYQTKLDEFALGTLLRDLEATFQSHPLAHGKVLALPSPETLDTLRSDYALLLRVLINMVTNALEASAPGDSVKVGIEPTRTLVTFKVWNQKVIPVEHRSQIFQRYFSTKEGFGRGTGTFAMKVFGEDYLGGVVGFRSSLKHGTVFHLTLPRTPDPV